MIRAHDELRRPQVRAPVAHNLHKSNELALISHQLGVLWRDNAAEEGYRPLPLMQHRAEAGARCVAVHYELLGEVGLLQYWRHRQRTLEVVERRRSCVAPQERVPLEEGRQRCSDDAVVVDETPIVPREPQEPTKCLDGARKRPILDGLDLVNVHGNDAILDDVAEVVDAAYTE